MVNKKKEVYRNFFILNMKHTDTQKDNYEWFDWKFYLNEYEDLRREGICTREACVTHWVRYGKHEGRVCRSLGKYNSSVNSKSHAPGVKRRWSVGVVITTHGNNGVFVRQCIDSFIQHIDTDMYELHIIMYINETADNITLSVPELFPQVKVVYVSDQLANGGLTGTWNQGIRWLIQKRSVDMILLSNDDLFVDSSIVHLLQQCKMCHQNQNAPTYFGPVTNNPGPAECNQWQYATRPIQAEVAQSRSKNLNGFLMAFPVWVLQTNMFDAMHFFDPSYPFGGNEVEWFNRLLQQDPRAHSTVVRKSFVYHRKLKSWRSDQRVWDSCVYTVNTGGYETSILLRGDFIDLPIYYFTDSETAVFAAIEKGLIPMRVFNPQSLTAKAIQRRIKAMPHLYLPYSHTISVYVDGNCEFKNQRSLRAAIHEFTNSDADVMCWDHPDRNSIRSEAPVVTKLRLETEQHVQNVLTYEKMRGFGKQHDVRLTETNMLLRRHRNIIPASQEWSKCIDKCKRDQLSFDFMLHLWDVRVLRKPYNTKPVRRLKHSGNIVHRTVHG